MARFRSIVERPTGDVQVAWSAATYPYPDPALIDNRPKTVATEMMLWRDDGRICCAAGKEYATEDEPLLMTRAEFDVYGLAGKPAAPAKPTRKRTAK